MPSFLSKFIDWYKRDANGVGENTFMFRTSRDTYDYVEGDHHLQVYVELLSGNPDYAIDVASIDKWKPPYADEPLTPEDKERILGTVCRALDKWHMSYIVVNQE